MPEAPRSARARAAKGGVAAAAIAAALAVAVPALQTDEGKKNVDYLDIARVPTACFGHTGPDVQVGRRRTDAECEALLVEDAREHMDGALRCTPQIAGNPAVLAAVTRLTFNIGVAGYCGSTIARRFKAGDLRGGCDAFLLWNKARVNGRVQEVRGLTNRRRSERAMCLEGLGK